LDQVAVESARLRVEVQGAVQGVGFRPFVYRLATDLGLVGWVINDTQGVFIEVEGTRPDLERFLELNTDPEMRERAEQKLQELKD